MALWITALPGGWGVATPEMSAKSIGPTNDVNLTATVFRFGRCLGNQFSLLFSAQVRWLFGLNDAPIQRIKAIGLYNRVRN